MVEPLIPPEAEQQPPPFPLTAVKALNWDATTNALSSPTYEATWVNGELEADCPDKGTADHAIDRCQCGIYATHGPCELRHYGKGGTSVIVVVEPYGTVVEAHCGVKSSGAQVVAILTERSPMLARKVADVLAVPVMTADEWEKQSGAAEWKQWIQQRGGKVDLTEAWRNAVHHVWNDYNLALLNAEMTRRSNEFEDKLRALNGKKPRKHKPVKEVSE